MLFLKILSFQNLCHWSKKYTFNVHTIFNIISLYSLIHEFAEDTDAWTCPKAISIYFKIELNLKYRD